MKLNTVMERIPFWYAARKCVYLKSPPGRGKTTTLSEAPKLLAKKFPGKNFGLVVINGPLLNPPDSVGYLMPSTVDGHLESLFSRPFWFKTDEGKRLEEYDGGVILVDEADKMDTDDKKIIGEAALSSRLGPHVLPKGWVVWMAGNRSEDRSGSTKELDHLINRRMEIDISDDIESWTDWALGSGVMPLTVAFANQHPQIVFPDKMPEKQGSWCTPRSLVAADEYLRIIKEATGEVPDDPIAVEEVGGMIGVGASAQYFAFVKLEREMPKYETIIKDPEKAKLPTKPDAQMLICYNLAHRVDEKTAAPVIKYVDRLAKEFGVTFAKAACKRNASLVTCPPFQKWCMQNGSLMASIASR